MRFLSFYLCVCEATGLAPSASTIPHTAVTRTYPIHTCRSYIALALSLSLSLSLLLSLSLALCARARVCVCVVCVSVFVSGWLSLSLVLSLCVYASGSQSSSLFIAAIIFSLPDFGSQVQPM